MEISRNEEIRAFVKANIQARYNSPLCCFSGLEIWAKQYSGPYEDVVSVVVGYLERENRSGNRLFQMSDSDIEEILNSVILANLSEPLPYCR